MTEVGYRLAWARNGSNYGLIESLGAWRLVADFGRREDPRRSMSGIS